jgi:hypothetical protein
VRLEAAGRRRLGGRDGVQQRHQVVALERPPPGEQLVEDDAERVDVAGRADEGAVAAGLLGGHVRRGADGEAGLGQVAALRRPGEAEVGDLDPLTP